jgi:4a-hydroxytetrahydrobiopterin dehydratase
MAEAKKGSGAEEKPARLGADRIRELTARLDGWQAVNDHHLSKVYTFPDFVGALAFVNRVGEIAEQQGHHPDIHLSWGKAGIEIFTHSVDGLSDKDFVLAARIDNVPR